MDTKSMAIIRIGELSSDSRASYIWLIEINSNFSFHLQSFMKNYINVNHTASHDTTKRHRALAIMRPMKNMSGNYECSVSTYKSNDIKSAHLQMIVPHSDFVLQTKLNEPKTEWAIECFAKNTYPEPELLIT